MRTYPIDGLARLVDELNAELYDDSVVRDRMLKEQTAHVCCV